MHNGQGTRRSVGFLLVSLLSIDLFFSSEALYGSSRHGRFWETVDVTDILRALGPGRVHPTEPDYEALVRLNLKYVYFNALRKDQFIAMPKPQRVAERMSKVFQLSGRLRVYLAQGRQLLAKDASTSELKQSARQIGRCAQDLHGTFRDFFQQDSQSLCAANLSACEDDRSRFTEYLAECEQMLALLDREIDRYFLNPAPGIIEISDYRGCSVTVLSQSIHRLSSLFEKSLTQ
jgi:hypothetical protein